MIITNLSVQNFRNLDKVELTPCPGVNIFYGDNAQGKTNLIESIWLFTGEKSFRASKDTELIRFGSASSNLNIRFDARGRDNDAAIMIDGKRKAIFNGIEQKSPTALNGQFCCVVFSPEHLSLIKDGPAERRRFLDSSISQIIPKYVLSLHEYHRALAQRNALLKDIPGHPELFETLAIWDEKLAMLGATVIFTRLRYLRSLQQSAGEIYHGISRGNEEISFQYENADGEPYALPEEPQHSTREFRSRLLQDLGKTAVRDIEVGYTTVGPHRDNLDIFINGISARLYGSQGQQRSVVLALKLAEAAVLQQSIEEPPILLLDDVMSELDKQRQEYLLNHIRGWQVFITCCDPAGFDSLLDGSVFKVQKGSVAAVCNS